MLRGIAAGAGKMETFGTREGDKTEAATSVTAPGKLASLYVAKVALVYGLQLGLYSFDSHAVVPL